MPAGSRYAPSSTVIAVDTNILVYAHRADSPFHDAARLTLESLAVGARAWAIPWPCAHEFFAGVTPSRINKTATPAGTAVAQLRAHGAAPLSRGRALQPRRDAGPGPSYERGALSRWRCTASPSVITASA